MKWSLNRTTDLFDKHPALGVAIVARVLVGRDEHALKGLPWVVRRRRIVPREVEASLRLLERRAGTG